MVAQLPAVTWSEAPPTPSLLFFFEDGYWELKEMIV
jgi:hypothetical protein